MIHKHLSEFPFQKHSAGLQKAAAAQITTFFKDLHINQLEVVFLIVSV